MSESDSEDESALAIIQKKLTKLQSVVMSKLQCPTSLCQRLSDSFKCSICLNTINPPVIYAHCCTRIVGCEACIDVCKQEDRRCPLCRADLVTSPILGLDELLRDMSLLVTKSNKCSSHPYRLTTDDSDDDFVI